MQRQPPATSPVTGRAHVDEGMVRVGPLMALPAVLESLGIRATPYLAEFGLTKSFFDDPENTLPMAMGGRLLGQAAARTRCEHLGLLVGQRAGASALGALGYLIQSSDTVGTALDAFAEHLEVQDRAGTVWIESEGGFSTLGYTVFDAHVESLQQILACAFAIATNLMVSICGPQWRPTEVLFAFARPRQVEPYRKFFGVRPRFDAERSGLVFPNELLQAPIPSADPLLNMLMRDRVRELRQSIGDDVVAVVRRQLRMMVLTPNCTVALVAARMNLHVRALNRELAAAGTTFLRLREEARAELACQLLESTRTGASEIAAILGYTEQASFTRAFQRWTGLPPTRWRAARKPTGRENRGS